MLQIMRQAHVQCLFRKVYPTRKTDYNPTLKSGKESMLSLPPTNEAHAQSGFSKRSATSPLGSATFSKYPAGRCRFRCRGSRRSPFRGCHPSNSPHNGPF